MESSAKPAAVEIRSDIALAPYTTFRLGGPAKFFVEASSTNELLEILAVAVSENWPTFILAGGSNLIVSDDGFDGLVILLKIKKLEIAGNRLTAGAGNEMRELVDASIEHRLAGLEWAGGLPGTFGGAIRGNAGCFGGEIKDSILMVKSLDVGTMKETVRDAGACDFGYRDSVFKRNGEVILEATLELRPGSREQLRAKADEHIKYRQDRHPLEYPNAGSIFKNVPLERVPASYLPLFEDAIKNDPFPIVPTAKIIAVAGLKGLRIGDTQISEKHTNIFVNLGGATTKDLLGLIEKVRREIKSRYGIELEIEPELVGFRKSGE